MHFLLLFWLFLTQWYSTPLLLTWLLFVEISQETIVLFEYKWCFMLTQWDEDLCRHFSLFSACFVRRGSRTLVKESRICNLDPRAWHKVIFSGVLGWKWLKLNFSPQDPLQPKSWNRVCSLGIIRQWFAKEKKTVFDWKKISQVKTWGHGHTKDDAHHAQAMLFFCTYIKNTFAAEWALVSLVKLSLVLEAGICQVATRYSFPPSHDPLRPKSWNRVCTLCFLGTTWQRFPEKRFFWWKISEVKRTISLVIFTFNADLAWCAQPAICPCSTQKSAKSRHGLISHSTSATAEQQCCICCFWWITIRSRWWPVSCSVKDLGTIALVGRRAGPFIWCGNGQSMLQSPALQTQLRVKCTARTGKRILQKVTFQKEGFFHTCRKNEMQGKKASWVFYVETGKFSKCPTR